MNKINKFNLFLGLNVQLKVTVSGPKYVQIQQKILLFCTSNTDSKDLLVSFHVNNQLYTRIHKNASGCHSSMDSSICQSGVCECLSDCRSFILQYDAELTSGVLQFKCSMDFKIVGTLSDCHFVTIVGAYEWWICKGVAVSSKNQLETREQKCVRHYMVFNNKQSSYIYHVYVKAQYMTKNETFLKRFIQIYKTQKKWHVITRIKKKY